MRVTRIGLIGDIHAEDVRLSAALAYLRLGRVDLVLSVGDVVDGPGDVERCVRLLMEHGVVGVRGNHDRWLVHGGFMDDAERRRIGWSTQSQLSAEALAWLAALPPTRDIGTASGTLLLCHGVGDHDMRRFEPESALEDHEELLEIVAGGAHRYVVGGHTHLRMVRRVGNAIVINAGTLTERGGVPGFAILDVSTDDVSFFEVDATGVIQRA